MHHTRICGGRSSKRALHRTSNSTESSSTESSSESRSAEHGNSQNNTALHSTTGVHTPDLLQTSRLQFFNSDSEESQTNATVVVNEHIFTGEA